MDKESIYELQKIDCNCNDCGHMIRNMDLFKESLINHERWQLDYFNAITNNMIERALHWKNIKGDLEKWDSIMTEAEASSSLIRARQRLVSDIVRSLTSQ